MHSAMAYITDYFTKPDAGFEKLLQTVLKENSNCNCFSLKIRSWLVGPWVNFGSLFIPTEESAFCHNGSNWKSLLLVVHLCQQKLNQLSEISLVLSSHFLFFLKIIIFQLICQFYSLWDLARAHMPALLVLIEPESSIISKLFEGESLRGKSKISNSNLDTAVSNSRK